MSFLQPSDFIGLVAQGKNEFTTPAIQAYIDEYEVDYLTALLGCDMYTEFIADLDTTPNILPDSVPLSPKFTAIFNAFCIDDDGTCDNDQRISKGFKEMLKYFIFWEYARDNQHEFVLTGATSNTFSNSQLVALSHTKLYKNYNLGIKTYKNIQWYICDNPENYDYDNYNGIRKDYSTWL
jgi:hypothetical protein